MTVLQQPCEPAAPSERAHPDGRLRDEHSRGVGRAEFPGDHEQQRLAIVTWQFRERQANGLAVGIRQREIFRVSCGIRVMRDRAQRQEQAPPDHGAPGPAACDGKDERLRRVRWAKSAPPLDQRGEAFLSNVLAQAGIAGPPGRVPEQPRGEIAEDVREVHAV